MRKLPVLALVLTALLAGCQTPAASNSGIPWVNACSLGICVPDEDGMRDADLQPNAEALLGFESDAIAAVNGMVRTDDGWAFTLRDATGRWHIVLVDEASLQARQYALPAGETVAEHSMLWNEGRLFVTTAEGGAREGVNLVEWELESDTLTRQSFPSLAVPARPVGSYGDQVLLLSQRALLEGDTAVFVADHDELITIGANGRVMDAAMVTGLLYLVVEKDNLWRVEMQSVDGGFLYPSWTTDNATGVGGIWGRDAHVAFNIIVDTGDPKGGRLMEIDHFTHKTTRMGQGWDVKFSGNEVFHVTSEEGTSPFITQWSRSLDQGSEGAFLPDGPFWDVSSEGLWWLEAPRVDHRYVETENPTPYLRLLMQSTR